MRSKLPAFGWGLATILWGFTLCLKTHEWLTVLAGLSNAFVWGLYCGQLGTANARDGAEPGSPGANKN
jgi:hypothetical protein